MTPSRLASSGGESAEEAGGADTERRGYRTAEIGLKSLGVFADRSGASALAGGLCLPIPWVPLVRFALWLGVSRKAAVRYESNT
jgi:hypothetical protein